MNPDHIAAFARRQWPDANNRLDYWAEQFRREGSTPALRAADALYAHARRVNSAVVSKWYRDDDLAHHLRVCEQLDRAHRAIASR